MAGRVIGLDPSLTSTGIAATNEGDLVALHNVKSTGKKGDTLEQRRDRLYAIATSVVDSVEEFAPELVVVESPSFGSKFGSPHDRSGLWWMIVAPLIGLGFPVAMVSPQGRAKYGTGRGNSPKAVVLAHVLERYSDQAPRRIKNDDEADAILLAAIGARHLGHPIERAEMHEDNLHAMGGVHWASTCNLEAVDGG